MSDSPHNVRSIASSQRLTDSFRVILEMMTTTPDLDLIMRQILLSVAGVVPCRTCSIIFFDEDGSYIAYVHGFDQEAADALVGQRFPPTIDNLLRLQRDRHAYLIDDTHDNPHWERLPHAEWIRATIGVPIALRDRVLGALTVDHNLPHQYDQYDLDTLQAFAHYAALTIDNIGQTHQLEQIVLMRTSELRAKIDEEHIFQEHLKVLHDITLDLTMIDALDAFYRRVIELGIGRLGFDRMGLYLVDSATIYADGTYGTDAEGNVIDESHRHLPVRDEYQLLWRALQNSERFSLDESVMLYSGDKPLFEGWHAAAVLWNGVNALGWLVVDNAITHHSTSKVQLDTLALYAGTVAALLIKMRVGLALRASLEREQELSQLKSRFVSMASHEFRTPLTTMMTASELLLRHRHKMDDVQIDRRLHKITEQVEYLNEVIESVLDLSKMQSGRLSFHPVPIDLESIVLEIIEELPTRPDNASASIVFSATGGPFVLNLDKRLMRQAISNLIGNAIKYSLETTPVHVELEKSHQLMILRVRDHGIGIPDADLKHLFEPFHRAENVGTIAGTGLGLSICKQAIESHGGRITVESQVGIGTTFTVYLPRT